MASFIPTAAMAALQMGIEAAQRSKQVEIANSAQQAQARYHTDQIQRAQTIESQKRKSALKEALATQRARFGAQGVGLGGSSDAVLRGLSAETEEQNRQSSELARLKIGQINNQAAWSGRRNLLDASQSTYRSAFNIARKGLQGFQLLDF